MSRKAKNMLIFSHLFVFFFMNIISFEEGEGGRAVEFCITKQAVRFSVRKLYVCSHVCVCARE